LSPNQHYINDSLGWVTYREGKLPEAEALLAKAYALKADAEILRHWITVLLAQGNRVRAQELVSQEVKHFAHDAVLLKFLRQMSLTP
jgi:Flp pilus assembly protein TadD